MSSATPPSLVKFVLPESEFAVPANELLDEEPIGADARFYQKIGTKYFRIGRLFQPAYFERFLDPERTLTTSRTDTSKAAKELKIWKEKYKNDFDTYEKSLKIAKDEKKAAVDALAEKTNELQRWQKTHSQLVRLHARNELEADFEHSMRLAESEKSKHEYESLAKKVNKLRSEAEAFNITETEVKSKFDDLCTKTFTGCLGHFVRYVHRDRQREIERLASTSGFDKAARYSISLQSWLGKCLLGLIMTKAQDEYLLRLGQWWSEEPYAINLDGMKDIDAEMAEKVIELRNVPPSASTPKDKKQRREQRFVEEAQRKALETMEMYLRWRADTTRLQFRLQEQKLRNNPDGDALAESAAKADANRIMGEVAQDFFSTLLAASPPEVASRIQLFKTKGEDAVKRLRLGGTLGWVGFGLGWKIVTHNPKPEPIKTQFKYNLI